MEKVAIIGIGRSSSPDLSFKELIFDAAVRAYDDAGIDPRKDVDSFVSCAEDYCEGFSIFDEFTPDQLGAVLRPLHTVTGDGLYGIINAQLQILSGISDVVVVEAHSKASDLLSYEKILLHAFDPVFLRYFGNPYFFAGLEMRRYMYETGTTKEQCARVVVKNRRNALKNPFSVHGAKLKIEDVLSSPTLFDPLSNLDIAKLADGAIVVVLSSWKTAKKLTDSPVWIRGVGWGSSSSSFDTREWGRATYASLSSEMAYSQAKIEEPWKEIDFAEIDDRFSYKELQHLEALKICKREEAGKLAEDGVFEKDGDFPVNQSGGSLGSGNFLEASGLRSLAEAVSYLEEGKKALVQVWRGIPTSSGATVILER
jgi:acetyl-CoA C-acetyltransferase